MTALAIHPSPSARRVREHAPGTSCPYTRAGHARRHLSVVPAPVEQDLAGMGGVNTAVPDTAVSETAVPATVVPERAAVPAPAVPVTAVGDAAVEQRTRAAAPARPTRLRLTTRGRRVFTTLGFALAIVLGGGLGVVAYSPADAAPGEVDTVVVQPGQSLWVIADGVAVPGQDVRDVIEQIRTLNALEHSTVHAGQELTIPAG